MAGLALVDTTTQPYTMRSFCGPCNSITLHALHSIDKYDIHHWKCPECGWVKYLLHSSWAPHLDKYG